MKHVSTLLFVALTLGAFGQDLPAVPVTEPSVELRLELASKQLSKAANAREGAMYAALFGGAMTAIAFTDKQSAGQLTGLFTIGAVFGLSLKGIGHEREAARLLHGQ